MTKNPNTRKIQPRPCVGLLRSKGQRGMVTVEYAIGAVLVIVIVGVLIASIQQGWFASAAQQLIMFILDEIPRVLTGGR